MVSDIPADVMEAATEAYSAALACTVNDRPFAEGFAIIARALLAERIRSTEAERERCAKVAEGFPERILEIWARPWGPPGNAYRPTRPADIAIAIRKGDHQ